MATFQRPRRSTWAGPPRLPLTVDPSIPSLIALNHERLDLGHIVCLSSLGTDTYVILGRKADSLVDQMIIRMVECRTGKYPGSS